MASRVDRKLGEALLRVMSPELDKRESSIAELINVIMSRDKTLGTDVRALVAEGAVGPSYLTLSSERQSLVLGQYLGIRALPQSFGVQFVSDCADRALVYYESEYPEDNRPRQFLELIRGWIQDSVTKAIIRQRADQLSDLVTAIDSQLDGLFSTGQMDSWSQRDRELAYRPLRVLELLHANALGITLPSPRWMRSLEHGVNLAIEIAALGEQERREDVRQATQEWQLQRLSNIVQAALLVS